MEGNKRLIPLVDLIQAVYVNQSLGSQSWIHYLWVPKMHYKLRQARISGPATSLLPCAPLRTPHWDIPTSMAPSCTPYEDVKPENLHFTSFADFASFSMYFPLAKVFCVSGVTWDGHTAANLSVFNSARRCPLKSARAGRCTDDFLVCLQLFGSDSSFVLRMLSDEDQLLIISLMKALSSTFSAAGTMNSRCELSVARGRSSASNEHATMPVLTPRIRSIASRST